MKTVPGIPNLFVLGNGIIRKSIDINGLNGTTYGCNAIYRDYIVDHLVAVDFDMINEIKASGYNGDLIYRHNHRLIDSYGNIYPDKGYSSGPTAIYIALLQHPNVNHIFLYGFDFYPNNGKHNNVYAGTNNYRPADAEPTYFGNWVKQISDIMSVNNSIMFYRYTTEEFLELPVILKNRNMISIQIGDS